MPTLRSTRFNTAHIESPYGTYTIEIEDIWNEGVVQAPLAVAAGQPGCKIMKLHAAVGQRIVSWSVSRVGDKPVLPSPITSDPNLVLKSAQIKRMSPALEPDDSHTYAVSGIYIYLMYTPPWELGGLTMGITGYDSTALAENFLSPGDFVEGMF